MSVLLGCIADDFTGATDIASFLVASGMRTVQLIETPGTDLSLEGVDAVVIALKSRTQNTPEAIKDSVEALQWLQNAGCQQFYFKYCSTFDSTSEGNIGPVADALLKELGEDFTIACPSLPVNGRTIYKGYLFVGDVLLNESGMENHPLTPMTDANIVRVLASQTDGEVILVDSNQVLQGEDSLKKTLIKAAETARYAVVDTLSNDDLFTIGHACADLKLLTGGSGLAIGLADNFEAKGLFTKSANSSELEKVAGNVVVLSGSCSKATREQVAVFQEQHPSIKLDPIALSEGKQSAADVVQWYESNHDQAPLLIYATDTPDAVKQFQGMLGVAEAGEIVEQAMADIVALLSERGVNKFVVAGGETSGSVVKALDVSSLKVGPTIAPGVPVMQSLSDKPQLVALKSGNFGDQDFFADAIKMMS